MTIAHVQDAVATPASTSTISKSFSSLPTIGNKIVVGVTVNHFFATADINTTGVTDNQGHTYTRHVISSHPGAQVAAIFSTDVTASSGTFTVTVDGVNSDDGLFFTAGEFSGLGAFDVGAAANAGAGAPATGNLTGTTSNSSSLEFAVCAHQSAGHTLTIDVVSPAYTSIGNVAGSTGGGGGSTNPVADVSYRILSSTTNVGASWTISPADIWGAVAATFAAAGGATVPAQVTGLSGSPANGAVALSWTAPSNGGSAITSYDVDWSSDGGSSWLGPVNTGSTSVSYTKTGLSNGTAYTFRVRAVNAIGNGTYSSNAGPYTPTTAISFVRAIPTSGTIGVSGARTITQAFDCTAANCLLVAISFGLAGGGDSSALSISTVTYNGVALSATIPKTAEQNAVHDIGGFYTLMNPASGTNNIVVTISGSGGANDRLTISAACYANVASIGNTATSTPAAATTNSPTFNLNCASGNVGIATLMHGSAISGASHTIRGAINNFTTNIAIGNLVFDENAGAGASTPLGATSSVSDAWLGLAIELVAGTSATTGVPTRRRWRRGLIVPMVRR